MNRKLSLALGMLSVFAVPAALAHDKEPPPVQQSSVTAFDHDHSTRSREEVAAEGRDAMRSGTFPEGDISSWEYSNDMKSTPRTERDASGQDARQDTDQK